MRDFRAGVLTSSPGRRLMPSWSLSSPPGSLLSWGRTRRTAAPPAGPPPGPQSQETATAGSRGSSAPDRPWCSDGRKREGDAGTSNVKCVSVLSVTAVTFSKPCSTIVMLGFSWLWNRGSLMAFFRSYLKNSELRMTWRDREQIKTPPRLCAVGLGRTGLDLPELLPWWFWCHQTPQQPFLLCFLCQRWWWDSWTTAASYLKQMRNTSLKRVGWQVLNGSGGSGRLLVTLVLNNIIGLLDLIPSFCT